MEAMIRALLRPEAYSHPAGDLQLLETHISWVLLSGDYAYKIKKPVNLGFVDFSTPERRRQACLEELRLNRRLAPELYLGLCPVLGPEEQARFHGEGPEIAVAVRMWRFQQQDLLPAVLARHALTPALLDQLADDLAAFHARAAVAAAGSPWGSPEQVRAPALANLAVLATLQPPPTGLEALQTWTAQEGHRLEGHFQARQQQGRIREGHGDLHLGNMALRQGRVLVFDCLEFSEALRWIDGISDLAFLVMDLQERDQPLLAARVLNRWLVGLGDYGGLRAWRWYGVYRALVRAKVAALRLRQPDLTTAAREALQQQVDRYLQLALATSGRGPGCLVITHGVSGSGKSVLAAALAEQLGWLHLRSDVERRRRFGRWGHSLEPIQSGDPYAPAVTEDLMGSQLPAAAEAALAGGWSVLVDATFLRRQERQRMAALAQRWGAGFAILDCQCDPRLAAERISRRLQNGEDPSEATPAVLEAQLGMREPLTADERPWSLPLAMDQQNAGGATPEEVIARLQQRFAFTR